jgi:hypothetical protein
LLVEKMEVESRKAAELLTGECFEREGKLMKKSLKKASYYPSNAATQVAITFTSHGAGRPKQENGYWQSFHGFTHVVEL